MKQSSKKFPGVLRAWSGVVAASLLAGCGGSESLPSEEPASAAQEQAQTGVAPILDSMDAIALDGELTSKTRSLIRAKLAQGQVHQQVPVVSDSGQALVLNDQGLNGDEQAGDGVFSAIGDVDFVTHRATQDRIREFQARNPQTPLTVATFDNRVRVSERVLTPLSPDVFRPGVPIPIFPAGISHAVKPENSLIITHPNVVNDPTRTYDPCTNAGNPNGVWTFNHLMREMASSYVSPANLTEHWLRQWTVNQNINGWTVPARPAMTARILTPWPRSSGALELARSPFKLVAIVNRLDLGASAGPSAYASGNAGELRFVFAAVDRSSGTCGVRPFLVIFEYGVPHASCDAVRTWAQGWLNLSAPSMILGSAAYNAALTSLTQQVVVRNAAPRKPNGSAINQIRTNEEWLRYPWELREFHLMGSGPSVNRLQGQPTVLTPGDSHNNTTVLRDFINANTPAILANSYTVPPAYPTSSTPFLGAFPWISSPTDSYWRASGISVNDARHVFSRNTCNGCHGRETRTEFTHIDEYGALSPFLATGMASPSTAFWVQDPVVTSLSRPFYEIQMRNTNLDSVANQACLARAFDRPLLSAH
ncbi:hypothetical protein QEG98_22255 [Myxococcus sp. MxC21-1]|uniref:choice-of-anchor X domain-containing protein n=1 Tax=Myxococcus sp. MxC21-1 TaxID=3041439 RepID=UPI00292F673D|nr:choice-of-anchor X domain-containing protein [Myxococcus sp. MxC21-1]WNZ58863.1 hypothetical protein QEG98_22255 [Myxococcus sp. MxC21-1]